MKKLLTKYLVIIIAVLSFTACEEEANQPLLDIINEDLGYIPVISSFSLAAPSSSAVMPGDDCTFDLRYWSEGNLSDIEFWLVDEIDQTLIEAFDYSPAYSNVTKTDSLLFDFTVPPLYQPGDTFYIEARVRNEGLEDYPTTAEVMLTIPEENNNDD